MSGPLWERQPGEPPKAFHAFCHYRDLPVTIRSQARSFTVHQLSCLNRRGEAGKVSAKDPGMIPGGLIDPNKVWKTWIRVYRWADRAAAYDAYLSEEERRTRLQEIKDMNERHANLAAAMTNQVVARLNTMNERGGPQVSVGQVPMWVDKATAIERRARGEATAIVKHQDGLAPDLDLSGLSDKELDQLERLLSKARPAEAGGAHG